MRSRLVRLIADAHFVLFVRRRQRSLGERRLQSSSRGETAPGPHPSVPTSTETTVSNRQRNEFGELLLWHHIAQGFAGPSVEVSWDGL